MNPYKEDGPCARLSFDPAYCKRCTGPPSVNDGYITGSGCCWSGGNAPHRPRRAGGRPSDAAAAPPPSRRHAPPRVRGRFAGRDYRDD